MRESFIFYKSFYESIKELDPEDQVQIYNAIFKYQFEGEEIDLKGICKSIFALIIPQLDANNKRYLNGKKGGAPKGNQNATKKQPKNNQKTTKKQPNENVNENDNVNVNDNDINNSSSSSYNNNIYEYAEKNFGRLITPVECQKLDNWKTSFDEELIRYAIKIAVLGNKKTFNYVNGILNNWKSKGYKTIQEIKEEKIKNEEPEEYFEYDWLNEEE